MTKTLTVKKAQEDLPTLVKNAGEKLHRYIITVDGVPYANLIPFEEEYTSESETEEILADKELMKSIKQGEKELKEGKGIPWEEVKKELGFDD